MQNKYPLKMKTVYILNISLTIVILAVGIILIIDYVKKTRTIPICLQTRSR